MTRKIKSGTKTGWAMALVLGFVLGLALSLGAGPVLSQNSLVTFPRSELKIETAAGKSHRFDIELAVKSREQAQGLMFRRDLAEDAGMLFIYRPERPVAMWMKNTLIPLDMLFVDFSGRIVKIVERTVPRSLETISSDHPVRAVLEVNAGTAARLLIKPGDRVLFPAFDTDS